MSEFHTTDSNTELQNKYPEEVFVIEEYLGTQTEQIEAQKIQIEKINLSIKQLIEIICLSCNKSENSDIVNSQIADILVMENNYTTQTEQIISQKKHIDKLKSQVINFVYLIHAIQN